MKLKYIIASLLAGVTLFSACEKEADHYLSDVKVDKSYVGFPKEGGSQTIKLTATANWTIEISEDDEEWLAVSPESGAAGTCEVMLATLPDEEGNETEIYVICNGQKQIIKVTQEAGEKPEPVVMSVAEALDIIRPLGDGEVAPGTFRIKGIVCKITEISTQYGNATYYLSDDGSMSGSSKADYNWLQVYRGYWLDNQQFTKGDEFGIGDELVIEGQIMDYKGTPETKEKTAYVVSITKSLIDVAPFDFEKLPAIDTTFHMTVTAKESPLLLNCDSEWLQIVGVETDGSYILHADENTRTAERTATIGIQGPTAIKTVSVTQKGVPATGASVSEIVKMADKSEVETLESTVIAKTTKGVVLYDGESAIYLYGDKAAEAKIGDNLKAWGIKKTYNGVPEIELGKDNDNHKIDIISHDNKFELPEAVDITSAVSYQAEAYYVKITGTVKVSGNYVNLLLDEYPEGDKQGSVSNPTEDLGFVALDGTKVTVTGWFNGLSGEGKYVNVIATKVVEYVDNPKGTYTNPYTPSEIATLLVNGTTFDENVYVAGIVSAVQSEFNAEYGNGTFWISDDGKANGISEDKKSTTEPTKDFECYRVLWFGSEQKWAEGNGQIEVGDVVLVCGSVTYYSKGNVAETSANKAWVAGVNGLDTFENGLGNMNAPFNVAGAEAYIDICEAVKAAAKEAGEPTPAFPDVCVGGIISAVQSAFGTQYGNGTFWISDDGQAHGVSEDKKSTTEPTKDFECFRVLWGASGQKWTESDPQPAVGDKVIVKGQLTKYGDIYETSGNNAWVAEHIPAN